jgi:DNA/RNA-binding domain of Phe-tRNA-synthetase-like protein
MKGKAMLAVTDEWKRAYPEAHAGILHLSQVSNPERHAELDLLKDKLVQDLRARFKDLEQLRSAEPIRAYQAYYKRFKKSYHVQHQLESLIFKGKPIPRVAALVEAMFVAELGNMLLTAGHDLDLIQSEITLGVSNGSEQYTRLNGQDQDLKAGDMFMADFKGIISSVIYGPDKRTMIRRETRNVLFAVYAPPGISEDALRRHLEELAQNVKVVSPEAQLEALEIVGAQ